MTHTTDEPPRPPRLQPASRHQLTPDIPTGIAVDVLAPLLEIDADSPESDHVRQHLTDTDRLASAASNTTPSPHSAALAIMPTRQDHSAEPLLAAQRDAEWRTALAASALDE